MNSSSEPRLSHDELKSLLAPYALHALEPYECQLVEDHIAGCTECADVLGDLLETASMIALSEIEAPSTQLWTRIEDGMRAEERLPTEDRVPAEMPVVVEQQRPTATAAPSPIISLDTERSRRRSLRTAVFGAVAAAVVVIPITAIVVQPGAPSIAALAEEASNSSGARRVSLEGSDKTKLGEVIIDADGHGYFLGTALPELPEGKTYQLWTIAGSDPVSVGVLGRSPKTSAFTAGNDTQVVALSIEDASGAVTPSTPIGTASLT